MLENFHNSKRKIYILLVLSFVVGVFIIFFTQNSYGGADSIQHYSLARWGWEYTDLLFNHWGKPVFTILISPFAQFGFIGVQIYNLILGLSTALLIWKIAEVLNFKNTEFSALIVLVTPVYFVLMFTSLTEVTFSFFLALTILLFFKKEYYYAAIIFSFISLIRTEGIVLIPLFATAFILRKKFLPMIFFSTGFWIISLIGYQAYDDYWWLITKMPYSGDAKDIYGSGSLFHFINNSSDHRAILGKLLGTLFIIGTIISLLNWMRKDKFKLTDSFYFLLLVPGSFMVFFAAHSFVWWQGIGNSLGLLRVIGSVTPLAALTALLSLNPAIDFFNKKSKGLGIVFGYALVVIIFISGVKDYHSSFKASEPQIVINKAISYIKNNDLQNHKIYYFNPYIAYKLGIDPYDITKGYCGVTNIEKPSLGIPDSSIIIWDAHFGPNEGRVSLDALQSQKSLRTVEIFTPEKPFNVLGGHNYEVHIFMKDISLVDDLITNFSYDFETNKYSSSNISHTGNKSFHLTSDISYIAGIDAYLQDMLYLPGSFSVSVSGYVFIKEPMVNELSLICSLDHDNVNNYYEVCDLHKQIINVGEWNFFEHSFKIDSVSSLDELLKVYISNKHKHNFYIDDLNFAVKKEPIHSIIFDFELESDENNIAGFSHNGSRSSLISSNIPYSVGKEIYIADLVDVITGFVVEVSGYIYIKKPLESALPLVCTLMQEDENLHYRTFDLRKQITRTEEWIRFEHRFNINTIKTLDERLKIYIWNKNNQEFYLDDFEITIETTQDNIAEN